MYDSAYETTSQADAMLLTQIWFLWSSERRD